LNDGGEKMMVRGEENRSVKRTKMLIRKGLLELMQEKPIQTITVKELVESIDMNRGTFYFHYRDIYDLLEQIEDEILTELTSIMAMPHGSVEELVLKIFLYLQKNADFGQILLGPKGDMVFLNRIKEAVADSFACILSRFEIQPEQVGDAYFNAFLINGFIGIISVWYRNGMVQTPEDMTWFATLLIKGGSEEFLRVNRTAQQGKGGPVSSFFHKNT